MGFVHLNVHTEFSIVDSTVRISQLIADLKSQGYTAVAVTDRNNLFAAIKFFKAAKSAGIKPILGADVSMRLHSDQDDWCELTLLCQNQIGYGNLSVLLSKAQRNRTAQGEPLIEAEWLQEYNEGLIVLADSVFSDVGCLLREQKLEEAAERAARWHTLLAGRYYVAVARIEREHEQRINNAAIYIAANQSIPMVASGRVRYLKENDFNAHEARICINQGYVLEDPKRPKNYTRQQFLRSADEMSAHFSDFPQLVENSSEIAKRCTLDFTFGEYFLPQFPVPEGETIDSFFEKKCHEFLANYLEKHGPDSGYTEEDYYQRLKMEIKVILDMGFPGYFLIVADFIIWSKNHDIPVGPGRGSGAGSLVALVMGITNLDPLKYELLFERFLNPERISMPDFDIDFCMDRRDEVIAYVADKYGKDKVSQIITYGAMNAKAVIRDAGRVLGYPYGMVDSIAKLIPNTLGVTLADAMKEMEFLNRYDTDEEAQEVVDLAMSLEGLKRNVGKHAGGIVIAPTPITDFCPVYVEQQSGSVVSQFDKDDVELVGLVKFDFLGLRTLTIIDWALQEINKDLPEPIDIDRIPLNDAKTFDLLKSSHTTAVFQLESRGMQELIGRLQPDRFEDIIALVALYRPGPLDSGMVDTYVECKHGRQQPDYLHPKLENILEPTYGVILYQEQVMQIAQVLSGYSLGSADILRRAMGKKKKEVMDEQQAIFVEGAVENAVEAKVAEHIFSLIQTFAGYGFNKSHSAAYALISYQTAYLKAHYPVQFMAAVLSADLDNTDKVVHLLQDVKQLGIGVSAPDVNRSVYQFKADGKEIVYGLGAIKGVGEAAIHELVQARQEQGPFASIQDMCSRINLRKVNRRTLEALIYAGAFDLLHPNRRQLIKGLNQVLKRSEQQLHDREAGQADLFGSMNVTEDYNAVPLPEVSDYEDLERLFNERNVLGHFLSSHPMRSMDAWLQPLMTHNIGKIQNSRASGAQKQEVTVAGLITSYRRRSEKMGVLTIEDTSGFIDITLFGQVLMEYEELLVKDSIIVVIGSAGVDKFTERFQVRANQILSPNDAIALYCEKICFQSAEDNTHLVKDIGQLFEKHGKGKARVYVHHHKNGEDINLRFADDWKIRPSLNLIEDALRHASIRSVIVKR